MNIALGGILSIAVSAVCSTLGIAGFILDVDSNHPVARMAGAIFYCLSYLPGHLSGLFEPSGLDGPPQSVGMWVAFLLLLLPNSFFIGYSVAGMYHVLKQCCRGSKIPVPDTAIE